MKKKFNQIGKNETTEGEKIRNSNIFTEKIFKSEERRSNKNNMANNKELKKAFKNKKSGFTLIEMVIVVTIIGILSGIVAIKYSGAQKIAKENADYANASVIATAAYLSKENGDEEAVYTNLEKLKENKYIDRIPEVQSKKGEKFVIENDNDDDIIVKIAGKLFYPKDEKKTNP